MMNKYIGVVISVDSAVAEVAMYDMVNDANILWEGQVLPGPKVGSFISILQGNVRIIAKVISEKIIDQQNSIGSKEFDNRYSKDSINRVIKAKSIGTVKGGNFQVTSRYVPMVGNKVSWISQEDYAAMYALGENVPSLRIGEDLLGDQEVNIPIDRIFASHIGVFGNTGSGKSNTLHRLYLNLFRSEYGDSALEKSKFIVIDFNGEYSHDDSFGVPSEKKTVCCLSTRSNSLDKITINDKYIFDSEVLSMLFDARPATQVPFIKNTLKSYNEMKHNWDSYAQFIIGTFCKLLIGREGNRGDALEEWIGIYRQFTQCGQNCLDNYDSMQYDVELGNCPECKKLQLKSDKRSQSEQKKYMDEEFPKYWEDYQKGLGDLEFYMRGYAKGYQKGVCDLREVNHFKDNPLFPEGVSEATCHGYKHSYSRGHKHGYGHGLKRDPQECPELLFRQIKTVSDRNYVLQLEGLSGNDCYFNHGSVMSAKQKHVIRKYLSEPLVRRMEESDPLDRLMYILKFSYIHNTARGEVQREHLDPLMKRIGVALKDLNKVVSVDEQGLQEFSNLIIVDLLNANQSIKRMIPMLFAKMMYGEQKDKKGSESTSHLIIDEAHNILNANSGDVGDHWRDYRLDVFEEIIKEGRKFGFYLTLSSQRPADISPTIVSQIHNYFIHRLVNELDLRMIERTMPTLDRASFDVIPTLGKGECVVTGTAFSLPVFTVVDWVESDPRPHSDDLVLTDLWTKAEYKSALETAEVIFYTKDISKRDLYNLLTSEPSLYSSEAAQYAVDNVEADWKTNALEMAKSYQQEGMSRGEIRSYLTSDKVGFTEEEAEHAISHLD